VVQVAAWLGKGARSSNEALRGLIIEKLKFAIRWLLRPYLPAHRTARRYA
jgi:hypothetical protein